MSGNFTTIIGRTAEITIHSHNCLYVLYFSLNLTCFDQHVKNLLGCFSTLLYMHRLLGMVFRFLQEHGTGEMHSSIALQITAWEGFKPLCLSTMKMKEAVLKGLIKGRIYIFISLFELTSFYICCQLFIYLWPRRHFFKFDFCCQQSRHTAVYYQSINCMPFSQF